MNQLNWFAYFLLLLTFGFTIVQQTEAKFNSLAIKSLSEANDHQHFRDVLKEILKPRIVGTPTHAEVQQFIISELKALGLDVELNVFTDVAPHFGNLTFTNIIGKLNPDADKYLVLSCHYDSKYFREHAFVGAIDSAVPCAMMLNAVKTTLPKLKELRGKTDLSLMLIFFDGEEAFRTWTDTDSLYGSRHLASKWTKQEYTSRSAKSMREIDRIQLLVLLDLIGASNPKFYSYYRNTHNSHMRLHNIETFLRRNKLLNKDPKSGPMFLDKFSSNAIQDDHIPFVHRDVPILHLIAAPFPAVWHKPEDNEKNLNMNTIKNINKVLRVFMIEYLTYCGAESAEPSSCLAE